MPYKRTGRPPGRPKTKEYVTLSARVSQDTADQVGRYARRHRQTLSEVMRDGFTLLLQEDRYAPFVSDTNGKQEILSDTIQAEPALEILSDTNGAPLAQENVSDTNGAPSLEITSDMNGVQEHMVDTRHMQRLREIVSDTNEATPELDIMSDMNSVSEIVSDINEALSVALDTVDLEDIPLSPVDMHPQTAQPGVLALAPVPADTPRAQRRALLLSAVPWDTDTPGGISPADIRRATGISKIDATNDLDELRKHGHVVKVGKGLYARPRPAPVTKEV